MRKNRRIRKQFSLDLQVVLELEECSEKTEQPQSRIVEQSLKEFFERQEE